MSKVRNATWFVLATGLVAAMSFFLAYKAKSQTMSPFFRPFIAQGIEKHFAPNDAEPRSIKNFTFARRSDGSHVYAFTSTAPDGERAQVVNISDLRLRRFVLLEPHTKSVATFHLSAKQVGQRIKDEHGCLSRPVVPTAEHSKILGYDTVHLVEELKFLKAESWVIPALDCYPLQESETRPARNETKVLSLVEAEPPEAMFEIPLGYVERSPSEIEAAYAARYPGHAYFGELQRKLMDKRYSAGLR